MMLTPVLVAVCHENTVVTVGMQHTWSFPSPAHNTPACGDRKPEFLQQWRWHTGVIELSLCLVYFYVSLKNMGLAVVASLFRCILFKVSALFCRNYLWHQMFFQHFNIKVWLKRVIQHSESCLDLFEPLIEVKMCFFARYRKKHATTLHMWSMRSIQCAYLGFRSGLGFPGLKAAALSIYLPSPKKRDDRYEALQDLVSSHSAGVGGFVNGEPDAAVCHNW